MVDSEIACDKLNLPLHVPTGGAFNSPEEYSKMATNSVSQKIARAQIALKAGKLENHSAVKSQNAADKKAVSSWGPMMRV